MDGGGELVAVPAFGRIRARIGRCVILTLPFVALNSGPESGGCKGGLQVVN